DTYRSSSPCFSNPPPAPVAYTLSLHDALPICADRQRGRPGRDRGRGLACCDAADGGAARPEHRRTDFPLDRRAQDGCAPGPAMRSEEHTSELQSRENLVCRLLLEKKNQNSNKR